MPTKTFLNPARTMSSQSSGSSARLAEASVRKPIEVRVRARQSMSARSSSLGVLFVADEIIVHDEDHVFPPAKAELFEFGNQLSGGLRAGRVAVHPGDIAKNSQSKGQPRENCTDIVTYWRRSIRSHRGAGVRMMSGICNELYSGLQRSGTQVFDQLRHQVFGLTHDKNAGCWERHPCPMRRAGLRR